MCKVLITQTYFAACKHRVGQWHKYETCKKGSVLADGSDFCPDMTTRDDNEREEQPCKQCMREYSWAVDSFRDGSVKWYKKKIVV